MDDTAMADVARGGPDAGPPATPSADTSPAARARPIRVAMLASMFPPEIGGIQSHTLRLGQKLADRGAIIHVITRIRPGMARFERMGGVHVHRVGWARARGAAGSLAYIGEAVRTLLTMRGAIDVVHAHQLLSPSTVALLATPLTGLPFIANPHACGQIGDVGVLSTSRAGRVRLGLLLRHADAFVAVSDTIRSELHAAGASPERVFRIGNGVDTDRFAPVAADERQALRRSLALPDGPLLVYAGRLSYEKGVDVLLEAWPHLRARVPAARVCILGDGPDAEPLRARARDLRIDDSVLFAGGVPDVSPYLRAADAAVLPSRTEGMPVALLEAMSCALPTVATRVGGSAEVLEDDRNGRLVPPERPELLAAGMAEALVDDAAADRWGRAARRDVIARYSMDLIADRFLALYRELVHRARRPVRVASARKAS